MNSIRRFVYAAALVLSALNFTPSLASAQDAAGTFTLTHESALAERRRARRKVSIHIRSQRPLGDAHPAQG
jgi:hypothetical protein